MGSPADILQWATKELCPVYEGIRAATGRYPPRILPGEAIGLGLRATFPAYDIRCMPVAEAGLADGGWHTLPLHNGSCIAVFDRPDPRPILAILPLPMRNKTHMWAFAERGAEWVSSMDEGDAAKFAAGVLRQLHDIADATDATLWRSILLPAPPTRDL